MRQAIFIASVTETTKCEQRAIGLVSVFPQRVCTNILDTDIRRDK